MKRHSDLKEFDPRPLRNNAAVSVTGPGGWGVKLFGQQTIVILLLGAALAWFVWSSRIEHKMIADELSTVSYLMSLAPEERPRLAPPANLKARILSTRPGPERGTP